MTTAPAPHLTTPLPTRPVPVGTALRTDALTEYAAHVTAAVTTVDPAALSAAARRIAAAVPGPRSAVAAEALARRWESAVRAWAADVGDHGTALDRSAREYADTDRGLAAAIRAWP